MSYHKTSGNMPVFPVLVARDDRLGEILDRSDSSML